MSLQVNHIVKTFGKGETETKVLKDIDITVEPGEFIILSGASGSGKSTLLSILGGLLSQTKGEINYQGKPLFSPLFISVGPTNNCRTRSRNVKKGSKSTCIEVIE